MPTKMTPERALIVLNQCNTDGRIKQETEKLAAGMGLTRNQVLEIWRQETEVG